MAERPYVAGAVAIGVVAAALHLSSGSAPQAPASTISSGGSHIRHSIQKPTTAFDKARWETEMKDHPENLGKITAEKELEDTLNDFYGPTKPLANVTKVIIAIEPDPVHTHLPLLFDRDIDALEDALQASGYQYQSNWLPWSPPSPDSSSGDHFSGQEQRRLFLQGRENYPGVILFRATERTDKSLAVFVVGNSPTGGIDRTQFEESLTQIQPLLHLQDELSILGPTFSGSGPSLRELLSGEAVAKLGLKQITVASGSVTDPDCRHFLPRSNDLDPSCHWTNATQTKITFVSFGIDKDRRTDQIKRFLHDQGHFRLTEVAELTEDESSYGLWGKKEDRHDCSMHLYFPRNISHLSSAYQKNNIFGFGVSSQGTTNLSLNLDLNQANDDDDVIPNFAEQQMPVSQDGIMHQITQAVEQHHIKVILLSATDVLDELFVAELLARQAPNALVVINQADNLFLRSSSPNNFTNMYFVSPFPLIGPSKPGNRIFPSDSSEGLYAAVQYLYATGHLNPIDPLKDPVPAVPDYSSPVAPTNRPALWLSAVGHGGYWPVAVLNPAEDEPSTFHLPTVPNQGQASASVDAELPHLSQELLVICLCLLALYHTAKCLGLRAVDDFSFAYTINDEDVRAPKLCLQLGITGLILLALLLSVSPMYSSPFAQLTLFGGVLLLCLAAAYLICMITATVGNLWLPSPSNLRFKDIVLARSVLIIPTCSVVIWVYVLLAWPLLWNWLTEESGHPVLIQLRASYPLRGVSPVLPLFIAVIGFCILAYSHLDRIAFTKNLRPRLPKGVAELPHCPGETALDPVGSLLKWPPNKSTAGNKIAAILLIMIFVFILLKPLHLKPQMFDGLRLQKSLGLAMFLLVTAILWELLMACVLWHRLKKFYLEPLESSSLRRGFSSISGFSWSSLWIFRGSLSSRYRLIHRLLQQASRAVLSEEGCLPKNAANLAQKKKQLENALADGSSLPEIIQAFGPLQEQIADAAQELLSELQCDWEKEKGRITACDATGEEEKGDELHSAKSEKPDALQQLREEWVALVYIHYIRMVLLHVRSRLMAAATLYVFLVWAATSYPYLNHHALLVALAAILGGLSFAVIVIYASINRDHILSRVTNHTPGQLDLDFYLKTASLIGVPLIGFIASQFPEISSFLFSWLEPGMAVVK